MIALSELDRARFGVVTAKAGSVRAADVPAVLSFCAEQRVELLVARCAASDLGAAHALEAAGARLMDVLVYFDRDLAEPLGAPAGPPVRTATADDAGAVGAVAREAFRGYLGHYHADARLDRVACDEVYADWASQSCRSTAVAEEVLAVGGAGEVLGFLTLRTNGPEEREIVLNAVRPAAQRGGVYAALVHEALVRSRGRGARRVIVSTQLTNVAVQRAWVRAGFRPSHALLTFHLWRDAAALTRPERAG